ELYRILITGPGDGVEGVDAGDLATAEVTQDAVPATTGNGEGVREARTRSASPKTSDAAAAHALTAAATGNRAGGRGAGGRVGRAGASHMDGMIGSVPPSPELIARVEALPPIKDEPKVGIAQARAGDTKFTLSKLLKPIALALVAGLVLNGLDAVANLALPALVRGGIN